MGNTQTALVDEEANSNISAAYQKKLSENNNIVTTTTKSGTSRSNTNVLPQDVPNTSAGTSNFSSSLTPSRMVRNVTHTTNATCDDSVSLSTCATNSILLKTSLSNDGSITTGINTTNNYIKPQQRIGLDRSSTSNNSGTNSSNNEKTQTQRKLKIHRKMKLQQQTMTSHLTTKAGGGGIGRQQQSAMLRNGSLNNQGDERQVVGVMYASPNKNNKAISNLPQLKPGGGIRRGGLDGSGKTIEQQDQWQSAWEEDNESSDDEDGSGSGSGGGNNDLKPDGRTNNNNNSGNSDTALVSEKIDLGVKWDKDGCNNSNTYEKPNFMMFFPLLRVLGKGSFGKVSIEYGHEYGND